MGQHTWFEKDKELFLKEDELHEKIYLFEKGEIWLDELDLYQINSEIEEIRRKNKTEYYNLFRTNKRELDGTYINDKIFSREECFKWINDKENKVTFENKEKDIKQLNEFWDKYPNGVIYFV